MDTKTLLANLKAANDGASDYRVAKILGVKPQTVSQWKTGKATMGDESGIKAAQLLGLDAKKVLLDLHIERDAGNAASPVWKAIREHLNMAAAPAVVGFVGYWIGALGSLPLA